MRLRSLGLSLRGLSELDAEALRSLVSAEVGELWHVTGEGRHAVVVDPDAGEALQALRSRRFGALIIWVLRPGELAWPGTLSLPRPFEASQVRMTLGIAAQMAMQSASTEPPFTLSAEPSSSGSDLAEVDGDHRGQAEIEGPPVEPDNQEPRTLSLFGVSLAGAFPETTDEPLLLGSDSEPDDCCCETRELTLAEALAELTPTNVPPVNWMDTFTTADPVATLDAGALEGLAFLDEVDQNDEDEQDGEVGQDDEVDRGDEIEPLSAIELEAAIVHAARVEDGNHETPAAEPTGSDEPISTIDAAPPADFDDVHASDGELEAADGRPEPGLKSEVGPVADDQEPEPIGPGDPVESTEPIVSTGEIDSLAALAAAYREQLYREREVLVQVEDLTFHLLPYQGLCVSDARPEQLASFRGCRPIAIEIDVVVTEPDERVGESTNLVHFLWQLGVNAGGGRLLPWIPADRPCRLMRQPPMAKHDENSPAFRAAAVLSRTPTAVGALVELLGARQAEVHDFLNGCSLLGYLEILPPPPRAAARGAAFSAPAHRSLVGRLRQRIGLSE